MKPVAYVDLRSADYLCLSCVKKSGSHFLLPMTHKDTLGLRGHLEEEHLEALVEIHGTCQRMYSAGEGGEFYEFASGFTILVAEVAGAAMIPCAECGYDIEDDAAGCEDSSNEPSRSEALDMIQDIEDSSERHDWLRTLAQIQSLEEV